jgi:CelD/BcsL family acetyltransferase involved in cellulose biosynthesis/GNAT superfamily N-acetyltransferase
VAATFTQFTTTTITSLADLERALTREPLAQWDALMQRDPVASAFQGRVWCMEWYRAYHDAFEPLVAMITSGTALVGLIPMAVERGSHRLTFATDNMADYRDVVAVPEVRPHVVAELLRLFAEGRYADPLLLGWTKPESSTPAIATPLLGKMGLRAVVRSYPCWHWFPPPPTKPNAKKFLNYYKRQGTVTLDVMRTPEEFEAFREEFYTQHSMRQLCAARPMAFDDPRKRRFYEAVFANPDSVAHVTALRVSGRMIAGHYGYIYNGTLHFGPPSIDVLEELRSPGVILMSLIIQNHESLGVSSVDLSIGDTDFKRRLGNKRVDLSMLEVFARPIPYAVRTGRLAASRMLRETVTKARGPDAWEDRVLPTLEKVAHKVQRVRELGPVGGAVQAVRSGAHAVGERVRGLVYVATPEDVQPVAAAGDRGRVEFRENTITDLLAHGDLAPDVYRILTEKAHESQRAIAEGRTLHTVLVGGRLAGWGTSYWPSEPAPLDETPGAMLEMETGSVSLYDFYTLPEFRGRKLYPALLTHILQLRFGEGAARAYIAVVASNRASRNAIERVGFKLAMVTEYKRFLKWRSLSTKRLIPLAGEPLAAPVPAAPPVPVAD